VHVCLQKERQIKRKYEKKSMISLIKGKAQTQQNQFVGISSLDCQLGMKTTK
jgi:hypothetical protein